MTASAVPANGRRRLPQDRAGVTRKITIRAGDGDGPRVVDVYVTVGMYDDGAPGEVFLRIGKAGSLASGMADALSTMMSLALQYGVPMRAIVEKLRAMRFEPAGPTGDPEIGIALSICDAVAKWLALRFCGEASNVVPIGQGKARP